MVVEISFQNWQALTALRSNERDSYDNVIERLLLKAKLYDESDGEPKELGGVGSGLLGLVCKGVLLPNGTQLHATYKGRTYAAIIEGGQWVDLMTGDRRTSPSQAASIISGTSTNGWVFWNARLPNSNEWVALSELRLKSSAKQ